MKSRRAVISDHHGLLHNATLRYSINVTWTGAAIIVQASRTRNCIVTTPRTSRKPCPPLWPGDFEMMEAACARRRSEADWMADWMEPFAGQSTRQRIRRVEHPGPGRWNAELVRGDLGKAVEQLKQEPGKDCSWEA